jgi:hypothetical protein
MTSKTTFELDQILEAGLKQEYELSEKRRIRDECEMIDEMSRGQLLTALGWEGAKANTARLRLLAKDRVRANDPHFDIWCGWNVPELRSK